MSRTRLSMMTAALLIVGAAAVFVARRAALGSEREGPTGTSAWEVAVDIRGKQSIASSVVAALPPDFRRQHVYDEQWTGDGLQRREGRGGLGRSEAVWRPATAAPGPYRLRFTFRCVLGLHRPTAAMQSYTQTVDGPPAPAADGTLRPAARVESDHADVIELARRLAGEHAAPVDMVRAFFQHVAGLDDAGAGDGGALDCLHSGGGDAAAKSRLFVALCRNQAIPARVVTGLVLTDGVSPAVHRWAEAWVTAAGQHAGDWVPADPTYRHFGPRQMPANYLVVRLDDGPPVRGPGKPAVTYFSRPLPDLPGDDGSAAHSFWRGVSFYSLPPAERQLVHFLVLLPAAAVIISVARVVIGVPTFGVFAPALLGVAFRDLRALPWALGVFVLTVLAGWGLRRVLDHFRLLMIPRAGALLTLIVLALLAVVVAAAHFGVQVTGYIALFPLVILTHLVERFWTVEAEDGAAASLTTLLGTLGVAAAVGLALGPEAVGRWLFRHPETLAVLAAVQLLLGRYTGYRLTELYRFQDLIEYDRPAGQEGP